MSEKETVEVFIEDAAGSESKNYFDERSLTPLGSVDLEVDYPYPYGFIPDTASADGDAVDCFVITARKFQPGEIISARVVGLMEYTETFVVSDRWRTVDDHKVLVVPTGEKIALDDEVKTRLRLFARKLDEENPEKEISVGDFLPPEAAREYVRSGRRLFADKLL